MRWFAFMFFIVLILSVSSCSSRRDVTGIYTSHYDLVGSDITLFPDSTFEYRWYMCMGNGTSKGSWKQTGKIITLNTFLQPWTDTFYSAQEYRNDTIKYGFAVYATDSGDVPVMWGKCDFYKHGTKWEYELNENGIARCSFVPDSFVISGFTLRKTKYTIKNTKNNYVRISLLDDIRMYTYFTNEKWKIDRSKLIFKGDGYKRVLRKNP